MRMLHTSRWHMHMLHTAYCIRSVISSFSNLNRRSGPLGLFYYVPLKRDQGDWDWRLRLNDTPNAIGCTSTPQTHAYVMTVIFWIAGFAIARCLDDASICLTPQDNTFRCDIPQYLKHMYMSWHSPLEIRHPINPLNRETQIPRYLAVQIQIEIWVQFALVRRNLSFWIWKILLAFSVKSVIHTSRSQTHGFATYFTYMNTSK